MRTAERASQSRDVSAGLPADALIEACPDALLITDPSWRPVSSNRLFVELWQLAPGGSARALWRRIRLLLADRRSLLQAWRAGAAGTFEHTVNLTDQRWIEIRASPLSASQGGWAWFCRDVTERTLRERVLRAGVARYRTLVENSPDAIYLNRLGEDGRFYAESANEAGFRLNEYEEARTIGRPLDEILPAWLAPIVIGAHQTCRRTARPVRYEIVAPPGDADGDWARDCILMPVCDEAGAVTRTILVSRDVTERRRQQQELAQALEQAEAAEQRAEEERQRLVDAIEAIQDGFVMFDGDERLVRCNSAWLRIAGVASPTDALGMSLEETTRSAVTTGILDLGGMDAETYIAEALKIVRLGRDVTIVAAKGDRWLRIEALRTSNGGIVGILSDITEIKRSEAQMAAAATRAEAAEHQAAQAEARLVEAIERLPAGFLLFDPDEKLVLANSQYRDMFALSGDLLDRPGASFEDLLRRNLPAMLPGAGPEQVEHFVNLRLAEFRAATGTIERPLADGRWLRTQDRKTPSGDTVSLRIEVTEIKTAEAAALDARQHLQDAIESLSEGFALYDVDGRLALSNSRLCELHAAIDPAFSLALGSFYQAALRSLLAGSRIDDVEAFIRRRDAELQEGSSVWEAQLANGGWIHGTERRMRDGGVVAMRRDITLLKHREDQLRAAMIDAMSANKAKSEFLANMSHELRTPLNAIIGFSEMIEAEIFGPLGNARYGEYVGDIRASGQHLLNIINTVLDLARVEAGKIVLSEGMVDIDATIDDCASLMRERIMRAMLRLKLEIEPDLPVLRADPVRLKQVVLNLLSNAVKFTRAHGQITVRARHTPSGGVAIEVSDTGIGMDPATIPKVFEPFGLGHAAHSRAYAGTGLGLPLSKALVEEHGGQLVLTSALGVGTTATVTLPAHRVIRPLVGRETAPS